MAEPPTRPLADVQIDCRGQACPRPIIELARAFQDLAVGATLAVVADDPAAAVDVQAWCRMRGQEYAGSTPAADGVPAYVVRRLS